MSRSGYKPLSQEADKDDLLGDILNTFDPASYFDDWFEEPATTSSQSQKVVESSSSKKVQEHGPSSGYRTEHGTVDDLINLGSEETGTEGVNPHQQVPESEYEEKEGPTSLHQEQFSRSVPQYGDESLGYRDPVPARHGALPLPYEEEEDGLSYDHYELVQAGVEPSSLISRQYSGQLGLDSDSGVVMDVLETSPYLGKLDQDGLSDEESGPRSRLLSKQSFDVAMSDEEAAKKAKYCLICLKTYCVIFILMIVSLSIYVATDLSDGTVTDAGVAKKENEGDGEISHGYKELRLGGRRVFYRVKEPEEMANHTVLLIHGENQSGEMFNKLGTLQFLGTHGARAVAVDTIGYGKSDPPIHIPDTYEKFFEEIVSLFELEYNLIIVCVDTGCEKVLPYYLNHGVYRPDNSFIEGAVFVSPRGSTYSNFVQPAKANINTATRTLVVNGDKDEYLNMEVTEQLKLVPRCEIHPLPDLKDNFYSNKQSKLYFHAALQAFMEGLAYEYDTELEELSAQQSFGNSDEANMNNPYPNKYGYQQVPQPQGGDAFSRFQAKQNSQGESNFKDLGYNPAHRFSGIKGRRRK